MIKNRYFKTTNGIAAESIFGKTTPVALDVATYGALLGADGTIGDLAIIKVPKGTNAVAGTVVDPGTALTAAERKADFFVASVWDTEVGGTKIPKNSTPLWGETIQAEVFPYAAPVLHSLRITKSAGTIGTNQEIAFKVIETTPLNLPLPTWTYNVKKTGTEAEMWTALAAKINAKSEGEFFGAVAGATYVTITTTDANRHFRLAIEIILSAANPTDGACVFTPSTQAQGYAGTGTLAQVRGLYEEENVRRGIGHYYATQNARPEEFGLPADAVALSAATTFDVVILTGTKVEQSPLPINQHIQKNTIILVVPAGLGADIATIFE